MQLAHILIEKRMYKTARKYAERAVSIDNRTKQNARVIIDQIDDIVTRERR